MLKYILHFTWLKSDTLFCSYVEVSQVHPFDKSKKTEMLGILGNLFVVLDLFLKASRKSFREESLVLQKGFTEAFALNYTFLNTVQRDGDDAMESRR